jgi:hypothetical protein
MKQFTPDEIKDRIIWRLSRNESYKCYSQSDGFPKPSPSKRIIGIFQEYRNNSFNISELVSIFAWEIGHRYARYIKNIPLVSRIAERYFWKIFRKLNSPDKHL